MFSFIVLISITIPLNGGFIFKENIMTDLREKDSHMDPSHVGFLDRDEVYDETEFAQHMEQVQTNEAVKNAVAKARPEYHPEFDGVHCIECDEEIPQARLKLQKIRCIHCQSEIEKRK